MWAALILVHLQPLLGKFEGISNLAESLHLLCLCYYNLFMKLKFLLAVLVDLYFVICCSFASFFFPIKTFGSYKVL